MRRVDGKVWLRSRKCYTWLTGLHFTLRSVLGRSPYFGIQGLRPSRPLSNPGLMLEGIKRFMNNDSELLITTPNAFGLLHFTKWVAGCFKEGNDHVLSFQIYTLSNLLRRHGFSINQVHTCYNRPPTRFSDFLNSPYAAN
jgi:hypothetical protein